MKCFKCEKELRPVDPEWARQPYAGTTFISYGHYGSTVWDPPGFYGGRRFLEIHLCDECLIANKDSVELGEKILKTDYTYEPWDPEKD